MIKLEIKEETFSRKSSSNCELSILQRMDSFVYMATDDSQKIQLLKSYELTAASDIDSARQQLEEIFKEDSFLRQPFRNVRVGIAGSKFSIIPNRLFNPQEKAVFLEQVTTVPADFEVRSDDLHNISSQIIYALPEAFLRFYRQQLPGSRFFHQLTSLVTGYRSEAALRGNNQLFLNVSSRWMQVVYFRNGEVNFVNSYPFQTTQDLIYFVMLIIDQHELEPENTPLHLSGLVVDDSEIFSHLRRYLRKVDFLPIPAFLQAGPKLQGQQGHFFYDLFNLLLCN